MPAAKYPFLYQIRCTYIAENNQHNETDVRVIVLAGGQSLHDLSKIISTLYGFSNKKFQLRTNSGSMMPQTSYKIVGADKEISLFSKYQELANPNLKKQFKKVQVGDIFLHEKIQLHLHSVHGLFILNADGKLGKNYASGKKTPCAVFGTKMQASGLDEVNVKFFCGRSWGAYGLQGRTTPLPKIPYETQRAPIFSEDGTYLNTMAWKYDRKRKCEKGNLFLSREENIQKMNFIMKIEKEMEFDSIFGHETILYETLSDRVLILDCSVIQQNKKRKLCEVEKN